jgi:hypothetical protein
MPAPFGRAGDLLCFWGRLGCPARGFGRAVQPYSHGSLTHTATVNPEDLGVPRIPASQVFKRLATSGVSDRD